MKNKTEGRKFRISQLNKPILVCVAGILLCAICAPLTKEVNGGVALGLLIIMAGTLYLFSKLYKEIYRSGIEMPSLLQKIFPNYPIVEDQGWDAARVSGFRKALNEYVSDSGLVQNSSLQNFSSQLFWHSIYLWKRRMTQKDISLNLDCTRRAYTSGKNAFRCEEYFDGRYMVKDIYEEVDAERTFHYKGKAIQTISDKEVAHYTVLSVKETENGEVICPNCGASTSKKNLIDGCDYCSTKFTVEDIDESFSSFGFRRDFSVSESKREAIKKLIYPWVFVLTEMPYVYFGLFGAFIYLDENIFARLMTGIVAALLFGLFGYFFVKINMAIVLPFALIKDAKKK